MTYVRIGIIFALSLIFSQNAWTIDKPIANVQYNSQYFVNDNITLDASKSVARSNYQITQYLWSQSEKNPQRLCSCIFKNKSAPFFKIYTPGRYAFTLTVDDGVVSDVYTMNFEVMNKYYLSSATNFNLPLTLKTNQIFEIIFLAKETKIIPVKLMQNSDVLIKGPVSLSMKKGKSYLFNYNEKNNQFIWEEYKTKKRK